MVNPGVLNPETGEYLRFVTTLQDGDELQVYRENDLLRVQQLIDGKATTCSPSLTEAVPFGRCITVCRHGSAPQNPVTAGFS